MWLKIAINKLKNRHISNMRVLKKKSLGTLEVYLIFFSCISAGFIGYKSLLSILFT